MAPTGREDSFPSWEGDGEDGLIDTGDPVTDDNDNNDGGDKEEEQQQQAKQQSPVAAAVAPPAVHAGDGDGVGSNGAEHKAEEVRSSDDVWRRDAPVCWGRQSGRFCVLPTEPQHEKSVRF